VAIYLFVCLSDVTSNWFPIRSTRGVSSLLRFGVTTEPVQIADLIVNYLKQRCAKEEPLHELFKQGEILEITYGPFKGFTGFFEKIQSSSDGSTRSLLLIEALGSVQKLNTQLSELKKIDELLLRNKSVLKDKA
jgi:transcriptional antiterminator RfaH